MLASDEQYRNGLARGICRHWDEAGRLLGKYRMARGTGTQRAWHNNGRNRIWLRNGTLLSERFYPDGRVVNTEEYRDTTTRDKTLPRFRGTPANVSARNGAIQKRIHSVFIELLLAKRNLSEAKEWPSRNGGETIAYWLGRFKQERDAANFVEQLYRAGAAKVIAPDIYSNEARDQFADCLLVRLSKDRAKRKAVRRAV